MAIADIDVKLLQVCTMSWLHPVEIWYKLVELCRKYNGFTTESQFNHTVLGTYKFCIFRYYKAIIEWILTNFFCFHICLISSFIFVNNQVVSDLQF